MIFQLMYPAIGTNTGLWQPFGKEKRFAVWIAKCSRRKGFFGQQKVQRRKEDYWKISIPKSTRESTKLAYKIFNEWQMGRAKKDPSLESRSFIFDMSKIRVDTNVVSISAESRNLWLTKFIKEDCKENGQGYPRKNTLHYGVRYTTAFEEGKWQFSGFSTS